MHVDDLAARLERLSDAGDTGPVPVSADLERGRRRLRRRRVTTVAAAAALVGALGVAGLVLPQHLADGTDDRVTTVDNVTDDQARAAIRAAIERHLDPDGEHVQRYDDMQPGSESRGEVGVVARWREPGDPGQGAVTVAVSNSWATSGASCPAIRNGPECLQDTAPDGQPTTFSQDGTGYTYAYEQKDGEVVTIMVWRHLGNQALREPPVSVDELPALAADAELTSPGAAEPQVELDAQEMEELGQRLVTNGTLRVTSNTGDHLHAVEATWIVDGRRAGSLSWAAGGTEAVYIEDCDAGEFDRCSTRSVNGHSVTTAYAPAYLGGGWEVWVDEPDHRAKVVHRPVGDTSLDPAAAQELVADDIFDMQE